IRDLAAFDVEDIPPGVMPFGVYEMASSVLTIDHPDYSQGVAEFTKTPVSIDHTLLRPAPLRGTVVVDDRDNAAVGECWISCTHESGLSFAGHTDDKGNYLLERVLPSKYTVEVNPKYLLPSTHQMELKSGDQTAAFRVKRGGLIRVRI